MLWWNLIHAIMNENIKFHNSYLSRKQRESFIGRIYGLAYSRLFIFKNVRK